MKNSNLILYGLLGLGAYAYFIKNKKLGLKTNTNGQIMTGGETSETPIAYRTGNVSTKDISNPVSVTNPLTVNGQTITTMSAGVDFINSQVLNTPSVVTSAVSLQRASQEAIRDNVLSVQQYRNTVQAKANNYIASGKASKNTVKILSSSKIGADIKERYL